MWATVGPSVGTQRLADFVPEQQTPWLAPHLLLNTLVRRGPFEQHGRRLGTVFGQQVLTDRSCPFLATARFRQAEDIDIGSRIGWITDLPARQKALEGQRAGQREDPADACSSLPR